MSRTTHWKASKKAGLNGLGVPKPLRPANNTCRSKTAGKAYRIFYRILAALLTEEDWVTRFYHEVAPTALADTSAPDRLGLSLRDKIIQPGVTRDELRRLPITEAKSFEGIKTQKAT